MGMVHVGRMRVLVSKSQMVVSMGMRLSRWIRSGMVMPMVCIMAVRVGVRHGFMTMEMFMALAEMEPHAYTHQRRGTY